MSARPKSDLLQGTLDLLLLQIVALQSLHGYAIAQRLQQITDRKSTRLNSSHLVISYAVFCLKKKTGPEAAAGICRRTTKSYAGAPGAKSPRRCTTISRRPTSGNVATAYLHNTP